MSAARRCNGKDVTTIYGPAVFYGEDGRGQACCGFHYGVAPELEPIFPEDYRGGNGKFYVRMIPIDAIEKERNK